MKLSISTQRAEAVAMLITTIYIYAHLQFGWWLMLPLWFAFDLSMAGYLFGNRIGALSYNAAHSFMLPAVFILAGASMKHPLLVQIALIEVIHITVDRTLGYGLKETAGFTHTHLGLIGKKHSADK